MNFVSALQQGDIRVNGDDQPPTLPPPPQVKHKLSFILEFFLKKLKSKVQNYLPLAPLLPATR
jgi:hypothetical protein